MLDAPLLPTADTPTTLSSYFRPLLLYPSVQLSGDFAETGIMLKFAIVVCFAACVTAEAEADPALLL